MNVGLLKLEELIINKNRFELRLGLMLNISLGQKFTENKLGIMKLEIV